MWDRSPETRARRKWQPLLASVWGGTVGPRLLSRAAGSSVVAATFLHRSGVLVLTGQCLSVSVPIPSFCFFFAVWDLRQAGLAATALDGDAEKHKLHSHLGCILWSGPEPGIYLHLPLPPFSTRNYFFSSAKPCRGAVLHAVTTIGQDVLAPLAERLAMLTFGLSAPSRSGVCRGRLSSVLKELLARLEMACVAAQRGTGTPSASGTVLLGRAARRML